MKVKDAARAPGAFSAEEQVSGLRPCWSLRDRPLCSTPAARPQGRRAPQPNLLQHEADPSREVAMQQHQGQSLSQRFQQYRPSKTALFWSCGGCVVLATIVGFSWGGWTTGGSAQDMADKAAASARQELAAVVCVDRFMAAQDADVQLTALKEITSSYAQSKFVEDGGWAVIVPASSTADRKASAAATADNRK